MSEEPTGPEDPTGPSSRKIELVGSGDQAQARPGETESSRLARLRLECPWIYKDYRRP